MNRLCLRDMEVFLPCSSIHFKGNLFKRALTVEWRLSDAPLSVSGLFAAYWVIFRCYVSLCFPLHMYSSYIFTQTKQQKKTCTDHKLAPDPKLARSACTHGDYGKYCRNCIKSYLMRAQVWCVHGCVCCLSCYSNSVKGYSCCSCYFSNV